MKSLLAFLLLATCESAAQAAEPGMFLCPSPVIANDFYSALLTVQSAGVHVDRDVEATVALKNRCQFVASVRLRPINCVSQELLITDGTISGWASPYLFIIYANAPTE